MLKRRGRHGRSLWLPRILGTPGSEISREDVLAVQRGFTLIERVPGNTLAVTLTPAGAYSVRRETTTLRPFPSVLLVFSSSPTPKEASIVSAESSLDVILYHTPLEMSTGW